MSCPGQQKDDVTSLVLAAGRGSRMRNYDGNKTLLPLCPEEGLYVGSRPLILEVLDNLPPGPKGIVVHHRADDVRRATRGYDPSYIPQPTMNGTGGALLASEAFLIQSSSNFVIVTMGDVPLIRRTTYQRLLLGLDGHAMVVLGFVPHDKAQYGMLDLDGDRVVRIVEWTYWKDFDPELQRTLRVCNAGVYAFRRHALLEELKRLEKIPHEVRKERRGRWVNIGEYFLTDLVELMNTDGYGVGWIQADEEEVQGVDTPEALATVQKRFRSRCD